MAEKFSRHVDSITAFMDTDLWKNKLSADCLNGNVFLAIRDNYISFYYKGGGLFEFRSKGFSTDVKYAAVIDKPLEGQIDEKSLPNAKLVDNFLDVYDRIKENCKDYSAKSEAQGVSCIYHNYPYISDKSNVVVLDIEITAPGDSDKRIDILLFNKELEKLRFIEAKMFSNDEIRSKTKPQVIEQLERYEEMIARRKENEFLPAYQEYTDTLNKIFNLKLPKPLKIDDKVGLLIFGFDEDQKKGRLVEIKQKIETHKFSCYSIGDIKNINAETLWNETN